MNAIVVGITRGEGILPLGQRAASGWDSSNEIRLLPVSRTDPVIASEARQSHSHVIPAKGVPSIPDQLEDTL